MMQRRSCHWLVSILCLLGAGACRSKTPEEPPAVCALRLPEHLEHTKPDALPAEQWFKLLFKGFHDGTGGEDPVDCSGEPIEWAPDPASCVDKEPLARELLPRPALRAEELIVRHAGGEYWFGWVPYRRFESGMGEGPIAIARLHKGRLEARALGTLRAYTKRARLEVRKLGKQHILTAEGEYCQKPNDCQRGMRLMWLDRQRFRERPLRSATVRNCLGPAWFPLVEVVNVRLNARWQRVLQRSISLAFEEDHILLDEHVTVNDRDVGQPSLPPRLFREAQAQLKITIEAGELLSAGHSLWSAIRTEDGSTELPAPPSDTPL
jgi:hypothetical protein